MTGKDKHGVHKISAEGFSLQVNDYEAGRPSYPPESVDHVLKALLTDGKQTKALLDVGAGTGKFTRRACACC